MLDEPAIVAALVSAATAFLVALITSGMSAWAAVRLQKDRLREELKLEFAAESAIRELLSQEKWKLRSFEAIQKRIPGFEKSELQKLLIRSGALRFERHEGGEVTELWGLRERNWDKLQ